MEAKVNGEAETLGSDVTALVAFGDSSKTAVAEHKAGPSDFSVKLLDRAGGDPASQPGDLHFEGVHVGERTLFITSHGWSGIVHEWYWAGVALSPGLGWQQNVACAHIHTQVQTRAYTQ